MVRKSESTSEPQQERVQYVPITQETRRRYLNYAMSVIMSRALPDVRDGLKPVQRRILYVMYEGLGLTADSKPRKCAKISGDTTGNYHPHGNVPVYEALVRMAQPFTLRYPLVEGQGNFGSVIGLPAAAERYTEARLTVLAEQLMNELRYQTVPMRTNYDGTREEPVVLPARFPNLLVNGTSGIAVGMATNIPPHNLQEVIEACVFLIDQPEAETKDLLKFIKGPDFPLGGRLLTERRELRQIYEDGRGTLKIRGEWRCDRDRKGEIPHRLVIYSVPYGVETGPLTAQINEVVQSRKLPQLISVNDETDSRHGLRIVLELKPGSDPDMVMAYLFKHTSLEYNFAYNSTCLIPDEHGALVPARLSLSDLLRRFLQFRHQTVRRRTEFQLRQLEQRIHILEGFAIVFKDLERTLKLIRSSNGRRDAADKLMKAFLLDEIQALAVVDLALYRISKLEIDAIMQELAEKQAEAEKLRKLLGSDRKLWNLVKEELLEIADKYGDKRRTSLGSLEEITEYDPAAYIVRENTHVVLTREGWIKRVGRLTSVENTRVREGDMVLDVLPASTVDTMIFFASDGVAYTLPVSDIPASSGYGDPISKYVKLADGATIVGAITTDPRFTPDDSETKPESPPSPCMLVVTAHGQVLQIPLAPFRAASTKAGRRYCRLAPGDRVVQALLVKGAQSVFLATKQARVIHFRLAEVPILSGPGRGVRGIKLDEGDEVLGAVLMEHASDCLKVRTTADKVLTCGQQKYEATTRGGKGHRIAHRSQLAEIVREPIQIVDWSTLESTERQRDNSR